MKIIWHQRQQAETVKNNFNLYVHSYCLIFIFILFPSFKHERGYKLIIIFFTPTLSQAFDEAYTCHKLIQRARSWQLHLRPSLLSVNIYVCVDVNVCSREWKGNKIRWWKKFHGNKALRHEKLFHLIRAFLKSSRTWHNSYLTSRHVEILIFYDYKKWILPAQKIQFQVAELPCTSAQSPSLRDRAVVAGSLKLW